MKISAEVLREQLVQVRARDENILSHRFKIKGWSLTIWVATVAFLSSERVSLAEFDALAILLVPIFLFWFLEALFGAITCLHSTQQRELERRIAEDDLEIDHPSEVFMTSNYDRFTLRLKVGFLFRSALRLETVTVFYVVLVLASLVVIFVGS